MRYTKLFILPILLSVFIVSCDDDDIKEIVNANSSFLRAVHASPDAPDVDVEVNDMTALQNVTYTQSSPYTEVPSNLNVKIKVAGTDNVVIDEDLELEPDDEHTLLAVNTVENIEPLLLFDDNTPPASGNSKARALHAAPGAPNVDIYITGPDDDISVLPPTLMNIPFLAESDYLEVPSGDYRVRVTPTGTKTVVIDSGTITLEDGQIRTIIAIDADGGGAPFSFLILEDLN